MTSQRSFDELLQLIPQKFYEIHGKEDWRSDDYSSLGSLFQELVSMQNESSLDKMKTYDIILGRLFSDSDPSDSKDVVTIDVRRPSPDYMDSVDQLYVPQHVKDNLKRPDVVRSIVESFPFVSFANNSTTIVANTVSQKGKLQNIRYNLNIRAPDYPGLVFRTAFHRHLYNGAKVVDAFVVNALNQNMIKSYTKGKFNAYKYEGLPQVFSSFSLLMGVKTGLGLYPKQDKYASKSDLF